MADDGRTPKMVIRGEMRKEEETETWLDTSKIHQGHKSGHKSEGPEAQGNGAFHSKSGSMHTNLQF
jgi:hypothetical protein